MTRAMVVWHIASSVTIVGLMVWWFDDLSSRSTSRADGYPSRPIHVVVPYAAGGGSDTFVRIMQKGVVEDNLLPQPWVIINQDGGIGTIGSREVKNADPDGYKILCHHNAIITAKLAETVNYGPEAFEPIAMTGEMSMVILVRDDAPYQSIADLLRHAEEAPKTVRFGANKGAPAYFTTLTMEKSWPGAEFSIVSSGGGADRYAKILGGHLEAGIFSLSEYLDFRGVEGTPPEENIRAIAVLGAERHESIPDVPTATEMGVPVLLSNANYWWAPKGTPRPIIDRLATVLEEAMKNETVLAELKRIRMDPTFDRGDSLQRRLNETIDRFESVVARKPTSLPDFPLYVALIVACLMAWALIESWRELRHPDRVPPEPVDDFVRRPGVALTSLVALGVYVIVLGQGWFPFAITSAVMVVLIGGIMIVGGRQPAGFGRWAVLVQLALLTAFGAQFIFSEVFVTPLP